MLKKSRGGKNGWKENVLRPGQEAGMLLKIMG